ncbi:MAG: endopeptidase La [Candidatus Dependentiae bacterium]
MIEVQDQKPVLIEGVSTFLPLLPLKNVVILPKSITPIIVGRPSSIRAVEYALKHDRLIFITTQKDSEVENPTLDKVYQVGTRATILQVMRMPNGALKILAEGICRAKSISLDQDQADFIAVHYDDLPTTGIKDSVELQALWRQTKELYLQYAKLNEKMPTDLIKDTKSPQDFDYITDTIAVHLNLTLPERQSLLEIRHLQKRILKLCSFLQRDIEILQVEQKIRGHIQTQVETSQREYYLHEQMKAIQKELGREDQSAEIAQLREKAKKMALPTESYEKVEKELRRLDQMPPLSSEAVVSRNYVDWILSLPWNKTSKDTISLRQAENILNKNHAGLHKAKDRIIEFLAAKKFSKSLERSPVICLVGPPGVGKTSLAKSISKSMGREFVRISLGGIKDEAEIRGHRRTYIGALPGKIIQAIKRAKTQNPVILLDEIDKMARDMQGDPASALLEVLDPQQNSTFVDHFLDVDYDLSKVMFIATANMMEGIPYPLFDRMEIISLAGYTEDEKFEIAKQFLIPQSLKEYDLTARQFKISKEMLYKVITEYTKEAGVRQLERILAKLMRKAIQSILKDPKTKCITINEKLIFEWLGYPKFKKTSLNGKKEQVGLTTGLAWTELGGDVLEIETTILPGKGGMTLTGQLGEVMQESAHAALSYIRANTTRLGLPKSFYNTREIHVHIPEGATPKDGPSAGITMCSALISALTGKPTKNCLALTGEITLQGRVLAVGGLKEKLLAAKQHDINTVIVPHENFDDIQDVLKETKLDDIKIIYAKTMDEVIDSAFEPNTFKKVQKKSKKAITKKGRKK